MKFDKKDEWVGVDFDGTLSTVNVDAVLNDPEYDYYSTGDPIPSVVREVQKRIASGQKVKLFTARVSPISLMKLKLSKIKMIAVLNEWCVKHLGHTLEITHEKDCFMVELWDDMKLVQVSRNEGTIVKE
jgi:hypothetical protein